MAADRIVLRISLEAQSPLMIASGEEDALADNLLVRDANGLPMIPATSLAGALRERIGRAFPVPSGQRSTADDWFGWQDGDQGRRSRVSLTDGLFHWSDNKPRDGVVLAGIGDELCKAMLPDAEPFVRQHVRLNEQGTVDGHGKFSRVAVPSGARFTFELRTQDRTIADALENLVKSGLQLGGATRAGFGELACVAMGRENMTLPADWARWKQVAGADIGLGSPIRMTRLAMPNGAPSDWGLLGRMEGPLLVGGPPRGPEEDRSPWAEPRIVWDSGTGRLWPAADWVVPGSAIKGPIRHRVMFHLRKAGLDAAQAETTLQDLFGSETDGTAGKAGALRFHDCRIPRSADGSDVLRQTHVGLDRFTGGARRGVLFTDAMLWQPQVAVRITQLADLTPAQHRALSTALDDMAQGLCGIGAEWGEGAGIFAPGATVTRPSLPEQPAAAAGAARENPNAA